MAWRWRCDLRFTPGSGMASWGKSQLDVRLTHAFHLREGSPDQELTSVVQDVVSSGPQADWRERLTADIFWPSDREDLAVDTRATFEAVTAWVAADLLEADPIRFSWMDYHQCRHDLGQPAPCPEPGWRWER